MKPNVLAGLCIPFRRLLVPVPLLSFVFILFLLDELSIAEPVLTAVLVVVVVVGEGLSQSPAPRALNLAALVLAIKC